MRQDQYERLQAISEKLTDVLLEEADPEKWPGAGIPLGTMDKATRGDRYWSKKNAVGTVALIQRIDGLTQAIRTASASGNGAAAVTEGADELDTEVAEAEAQAAQLLDKVQKDARKKEFDKRVHGKS